MKNKEYLNNLEVDLDDLLYIKKKENRGKVTPEQLSKALKSWPDNPHEAIYCVRKYRYYFDITP